MKKILITGGSGFLGGHLLFYLGDNKRIKIYATYNSQPIENCFNAETCKLDITDEENVRALIKRVSPDIIIHTAALTNSNLCFDDKNLAHRVNVLGTKNLVTAAKKCGARFIYTSTDLIHKGDNSFYTEEDNVSPICNYGKTKLEGEKQVLSLGQKYCIFRTALMYGISKNSNKTFSELMIENIKSKKEVTLFIDEYRTPLNVLDFLKVIDKVIEKEEITGVFNISGNNRSSRYDFGGKLCEFYGLDKTYLKPVSVLDFNFRDGRPKDCSLDNRKICNALDFKFSNL